MITLLTFFTLFAITGVTLIAASMILRREDMPLTQLAMSNRTMTYTEAMRSTLCCTVPGRTIPAMRQLRKIRRLGQCFMHELAASSLQPRWQRWRSFRA